MSTSSPREASVEVRVRPLPGSSYTVEVAPGLLGRAGVGLKRAFPGRRAFVVSSPRVRRLWGGALAASLRRAGWEAPGWHLVPDGEEHKDFRSYGAALAALAAWDRGLKGRPLVLLLGGGVVGDLGGFAAATFRRGVPFVQIPTTLLSMVDSSVGGKLGVDFDTPAGRVKNLVGAFAQPGLVLADPDLLATLDARQMRSGLGEVVKTAVLFDPALFRRLEAAGSGLLTAHPALHAEVVATCVAHKARVVERDPLDRKGLRALLNLGHTFGHAVESASGFALAHGEAVGFGLACAADLSRALGLLDAAGRKDMDRLEALLAALGLPLRLKGPRLDRVLAALARDKKFEGGARFIVPLRLGRCAVRPLRSLAPVRALLARRLGAA